MNGSVVMLRVIMLCHKKTIMLSVVIVSVMAPIVVMFRVTFSFVLLSA